MIRTVSTVLLAFIVGAGAALLYAQNTSNSAPLRNTTQTGTIHSQEDAYQDMIAVKEAAIAKLATENAELAARIQLLEEDVDTTEALNEFETLADSVDSAQEIPSPVEQDDSERRGRFGRGDDEPTPEQRTEFVNRMRGRMVDMWNAEWEKATPESQARITAISDYQQEIMDGRMALRDAASDEEREEIRASLSETETLLRATLSEEQQSQIRQLVDSHDLNSAEGIDTFIVETRQLMQSPIFNMGGGGGAGGWGRGGRGRR